MFNTFVSLLSRHASYVHTYIYTYLTTYSNQTCAKFELHEILRNFKCVVCLYLQNVLSPDLSLLQMDQSHFHHLVSLCQLLILNSQTQILIFHVS